MRPGRDVDHPNPSSAKVKERIEFYLYTFCFYLGFRANFTLNSALCPANMDGMRAMCRTNTYVGAEVTNYFSLHTNSEQQLWIFYPNGRKGNVRAHSTKSRKGNGNTAALILNLDPKFWWVVRPIAPVALIPGKEHWQKKKMMKKRFEREMLHFYGGNISGSKGPGITCSSFWQRFFWVGEEITNRWHKYVFDVILTVHRR